MSGSNAVVESEMNALETMPASEEIITLLAHAPNLLDFQPSEKARAHVWKLVAKEKARTLTNAERSELDHYAQIEHLMRLVKAQARRLQQQPCA